MSAREESHRQKDKLSSSEDALLEEYKSCDELAKHIDKMIWQLASVVFPIALAGLTYFGISLGHAADQFVIVLAVASGSVALLIAWYLLANQWAGYQRLTYYRMREIETELGLWHYRYAVFVKQPIEERKLDIERLDTEIKERFERLDSFFGKFRHFGYTRARTTVTAVFVLGWIALVIRELILTFIM